MTDNCSIREITSDYASGTFIPVGATVVTYTAVDNAGFSTQCSFTVTRHSTPTADGGASVTINSGDNTVLGGAPSASGGSGNYTYLWIPSTGLDADNIANPTANPTSTVQYTLIVTDDVGCAAFSSVTVHVNGTPSVCARPTNNTVLNITETTATVDWDDVNGADRYQLQYQAKPSGSLNTTLTFISEKALTGLSSGTNYRYRVRARCPGINAFSPWKFGQFTTTSPRLSDNAVSHIAMYPNPASNSTNIHISADSGEEQPLVIEVFNMIGQRVYQMETEIAGTWSAPIDLTTQASGHYLVKIRIGEMVSTKDLVISK